MIFNSDKPGLSFIKILVVEFLSLGIIGFLLFTL